MHKLLCALVLCATVAFAADISGTWKFTVETNQGTRILPTAVFQQNGDKLTGTFNSQILGEVKLTGSVKGNAVEFSFAGADGQTIQASYKGTIESSTAMKGTAVYAASDDKATWSATKK